MALQEEFEKQGNYLFKYRGTLPLILLGLGVITFAYNKYYGIGYEKYIAFERYELICLAVCFFGLLIRIYTVGHTPKNTSGRNTASQVADELNTTGIYSLVRHPLYVGNFFMWLGAALLAQNWWFNISFVFIYWVYYERIMFAEEQFLRGKFQDTYLGWAKDVPAFIPSFKNFVSPKYSFNWKKVLQREKSGFTAIFVVFFLFHSLGDFIEKKPFDANSWILKALLFSLCLHLVLKVLKKTNAFNEEKR